MGGQSVCSGVQMTGTHFSCSSLYSETCEPLGYTLLFLFFSGSVRIAERGLLAVVLLIRAQNPDKDVF